MELRLLRSHVGGYYSDKLQYRAVYCDLSRGEVNYSEWQDVPIVDENATNKSNNADDSKQSLTNENGIL